MFKLHDNLKKKDPGLAPVLYEAPRLGYIVSRLNGGAAEWVNTWYTEETNEDAAKDMLSVKAFAAKLSIDS